MGSRVDNVRRLRLARLGTSPDSSALRREYAASRPTDGGSRRYAENGLRRRRRRALPGRRRLQHGTMGNVIKLTSLSVRAMLAKSL